MTLPYFQVDTRNEHLKTLTRRHSSLWTDFQDKLILSWIYHDHGLEGVVLQPHELMDALNQRPVTDNSSQMLYQDIVNLSTAIAYMREFTQGKKKDDRITRSFVQSLHQRLSENVRGVPDTNGIRKEDGRYGAYYHKCCPFEEVEGELRKLMAYYNQNDVEDLHPLVHAARFHFQFMKLMPFGRFSGKIVRLLTNLLLLRHDYPPSIIHTVERARYYEALAQDDENLLLHLLSESMQSTVESGLQFLEQGIAERRRKREARKARQQKKEAAKKAKPSASTKASSTTTRSSKSKGRKQAAKKGGARSTKTRATTSRHKTSTSS